jgi:DegV family protein with EDD domain
MLNIHIVTDSCAYFADPRIIQRFPITVVPNKLQIAGKVYQDGVDLSTEEAFRLIAEHPETPPLVISPAEADFVRAYNKAAKNSDAIISIHASREMFSSWQNARRAAQQLSGNSEIAVIDSRTLCAGQGMLVKVAAEAMATTDVFDNLVRKVRGAVERVYSVYYVESVNFLLHSKIISVGHSILSAMLGLKPFLAVEEGRLVATEKIRTRSQAVERIVEFAVEFDAVQDAVILQHRPGVTEQTRMLHERLAVEFPGREFPHSLYSPALAAIIGVDASGFVLLEDETGMNYGF